MAARTPRSISKKHHAHTLTFMAAYSTPRPSPSSLAYVSSVYTAFPAKFHFLFGNGKKLSPRSSLFPTQHPLTTTTL
jgi:hypothetical protein